mmetsp:Transcript_32206/g.55063  ORF Transcript_32206/g.55063 Transcript_32206/m.55063 type:complete len:82 (-) Transcript_32206:103-348(-)
MSANESIEMNLSHKDARERCWIGRDKYFECLDNNENNDEKCKSERKAFEEVCSSIWVKHFINKRTQDLKKKRFQEISAQYK